MRGCFVTGTDTGVGKTAVAAAIAATLRARGEQVTVSKPILTGTMERGSGAAWPPDDVVLARAGGQRPSEVTQLRFGPPASPHLAAQLEGAPPIDPESLVTRLRAALDGAGAAVVEGVGGLLVPLTPDGYTVRDMARQLGLPVVVAARPGLGTISHTLLTLEAARAGALDVRSVVLTPWPDHPGRLEHSNAATIARLGRVSVHCLARVGGPRAREFVQAAAGLPIEEWLQPGSDRVAA